MEKTKEAGIGLSIGGIMNIILDPIFIFKKGAPLFGGAVTDTVSFIFAAVLYSCFKKAIIKEVKEDNKHQNQPR